VPPAAGSTGTSKDGIPLKANEGIEDKSENPDESVKMPNNQTAPATDNVATASGDSLSSFANNVGNEAKDLLLSEKDVTGDLSDITNFANGENSASTQPTDKQKQESSDKSIDLAYAFVARGSSVEKMAANGLWSLFPSTGYMTTLRTRQPASDDEGYELVGNLPYGAWNYIDADGVLQQSTELGSSPLIAKIQGDPKAVAAEEAEGMEPDQVFYPSTTKDKNYHFKRLEELQGKFSVTGVAKTAAEMTTSVNVSGQEDQCDCECHLVDPRMGHKRRMGEQINGEDLQRATPQPQEALA
jgi:hypothetical protein